MKYLFGEKSGPEAPAEKAFCTAEAPQSMAEDLTRAKDALETSVRAALPQALLILKTLSMAAALLLLGSFLRALAKVSPAQAYHNAPAIIWIGGAALLLWLGCLLYERVQLKRLGQPGEGLERRMEELERRAESAKRYLEVPEDTEEIDVLVFRYRQDKDGLRFRGKAANGPVELYRRGDTLCLFDGLRVFSLLLEGASLHLLQLGVPVDGATWNKTAGPNAKQYRKYGVTVNQAVQLGLSFCCALELAKGGERYRLLFPAYELAAMKRLTGLPAPALPKDAKGKAQAAPERAEDFAWSSGPVRPRYYWHWPKGEAGEWFSLSSDEEFKAAHPVLYGVFVAVGLILLLGPGLVFSVLAGRAMGDPNNGWILLGFFGGFVAGVGLFNLAAAWLHQYLGHFFTLACLLLGGALMAFTWFVLL